MGLAMNNYYKKLSRLQLSVLSEIGNIGAGNAATSLASILSNRVTMSVPLLQVIDVTDMIGVLGGPEKELAGILVNMTGEVNGLLLFLLDKEFVGLLIKVLLDKDLNELSDAEQIDLSAMMEIGNILSGSYISAISSMTGLQIRLTTPQIAIDMAGAILNYPAALFGIKGEQLLFIEEVFSSGESKIKSHLLIMPDPDSLDKIMNSLGV